MKELRKNLHNESKTRAVRLCCQSWSARPRNACSRDGINKSKTKRKYFEHIAPLFYKKQKEAAGGGIGMDWKQGWSRVKRWLFPGWGRATTEETTRTTPPPPTSESRSMGANCPWTTPRLCGTMNEVCSPACGSWSRRTLPPCPTAGRDWPIGCTGPAARRWDWRSCTS